jgi:hypothetical protein
MTQSRSEELYFVMAGEYGWSGWDDEMDLEIAREAEGAI